MSFALRNRFRSIPPASQSEQAKPRVAPVAVPMTPPPALPPAGDAVPLGLWRGKALAMGAGQISVREVKPAEAKWVLKLELPNSGLGDYLDFYQSFACLVWWHRPAADLGSQDGCMVIDRAGVESSQDGVGKAVAEVKTLVGFMELIGGNLSHICAWLNQPQL